MASELEAIVMESSGIYWKSLFAALERAGIIDWIVDARHAKDVPERKKDVADAQWLACLARAGLFKPSIAAKDDVRHLRRIVQRRQRLVAHPRLRKSGAQTA